MVAFPLSLAYPVTNQVIELPAALQNFSLKKVLVLLFLLTSLTASVYLVGQRTGWFGRAAIPNGSFPDFNSRKDPTPHFVPGQIIIKLKPGYTLGQPSNNRAFSIQSETGQSQAAQALNSQLLNIGTTEVKKTISSARSPKEIASAFAQKFPQRAGTLGIQQQVNKIPDLTRFYTVTFDQTRFGLTPPGFGENQNPREFGKYQEILARFKANPVVEDVQLNYVYTIDQTHTIIGSIDGPTVGTTDSTLKYTARGSSDKNIRSVAIYWAKTTSDVTQGSSWTQIAKTDNCTSYFTAGLGDCPAEGTFTPKEVGEYYISVVVIGDVGPCSGNPKYDAVAGWLDCGQNDLIKLTVSPSGGVPSPTPTPVPTPTPSASPSPLPSPTPVTGYPNDPYFWSSNSWGQGYDDLWDMKKIKTDLAWPLVATSSATIIVAVSDTGVDYNHEDLKDVMWTDSNGKHGYDFVNNDDDPMDDHYHGTHVAGTIGAAINNGKGIAGVAPNVKIMAVKGLDNWGSGWSDDLADGIVWATDHGANVINMSWGGGGDSPILQEALEYAYVFGVLPVAAAGNSNEDVVYSYPAKFNVVMAISASDPNDERTYFSNWGSKIDLAAPGGGTWSECNMGLCSNILSTEASLSSLPVERKVATHGAGYARLAGTSMAAPHVAGAAAMVLAVNSTLSPQQVRNVLLNSADDVGLEGKDPDSGYGRLNVYKAVTEMNTKTPPLPQIEITQPVSGQRLRQIVSITGSVFQPGGEAVFEIAYAVSKDGPWQTDGITLTNNGVGNITNDVLGTWDTKVVSGGKYYLRVQAGTTKKTTDLRVGTVYNELPNGWPVKLLQLGYGIGPVTAGDLDGDGTDETVIRFGSEIHVLNANGEEMGGWPLELGDYNRWVGEIPSIGNVSNQNPGEEIILDSWGSELGASTVLPKGVYVLDKDGRTLSGWPKSEAGGYSLAPSYRPKILEDLDGDGLEEIIYTTYDPSTYNDMLVVFRGDGTVLPGFPVVISNGYIRDNPHVVQVDGEKRIVIIAGYYSQLDTRILQYDVSGRLIFSSNNINLHPQDSLLVDVTDDGTPEIVWSSRPYDLSDPSVRISFNAIDLQGNVINGWPKIINTGITRKVDNNRSTLEDYFGFTTLPADFDGDGKSDIVQLGVRYSRTGLWDPVTETPLVFGLRHDGTELTFPVPDGAYPPVYWQPHAVLDTNGDGKQEIVYIAHNNTTKHYFLNSFQLNGGSGELVMSRDIASNCEYYNIAGYEYFYTDYVSPVIAQLSGSGRPSIIASVCGYVSSDRNERRMGFYPVSLEGPATQHAWPQYLHDARRTNQYSLVGEQGAVNSQSLQLDSGWNMIGLTVDKGQNYKAEDFARELNSSLSGDKIVNIIGWQNGRYVVYSVGSDANNFFIVPGQGYFVKSTDDGTATISGATPTLTSINISSAWSLISFPRQMEGIQNAEDLLQAMKAQSIGARTIIRWVGGRYGIHQIDSTANNFPITTGEGYFIRNFGQAGTFTLP